MPPDLPPLPPLPPIHRRLTLPDFGIGHASDITGKTGLTVIACPEGAVAAADLRGSATGSRQFDSLVNPQHLAKRAHALVFAGGSGFGLDCGGAVAERLAAEGHGFETGLRRVPLVPTAILFDLGFGDPQAAPTAAMARQALAAAKAFETGAEVEVGSVGAGVGATVGKALGAGCSMKGGLGFAACEIPGRLTVAAVVAVNTFGDVRDPASGALVAGCRESAGSPALVGTERLMAALAPDHTTAWEGNTTLAAVLTDAVLDKGALTKLCQMAFGGLYRTLSPALSLYDGDMVVALSSARRPAHLHQVAVLAQRAIEAAVLTAVEAADGFGLVPAMRDLPSL